MKIQKQIKRELSYKELHYNSEVAFSVDDGMSHEKNDSTRRHIYEDPIRLFWCLFRLLVVIMGIVITVG